MSGLNIDQCLCQAEKSSLLIIDAQEHLIAAMPNKIVAKLKRNINILLQATTSLTIPVLVTEQYPKGLGAIDTEIAEQLPAYSSHFEKTCFSCTEARNFMPTLEKLRHKQIIVTGLEAHICVLQTAIKLIDKGYHVFIVADAICSREKQSYQLALYRMQQSGAVICTTESVLFEWLKDSKHNDFKRISHLIR